MIQSVENIQVSKHSGGDGIFYFDSPKNWAKNKSGLTTTLAKKYLGLTFIVGPNYFGKWPN